MESAPEDVGVCDLGGPFRGLRKEEACWRKWTNVEAHRSEFQYMCH